MKKDDMKFENITPEKLYYILNNIVNQNSSNWSSTITRKVLDVMWECRYEMLLQQRFKDRFEEMGDLKYSGEDL